MKQFIGQNRHWVGRTAVLAGMALLGEHLYQYGGFHLTFPDHGVVGLALIVLGSLLAALKPGEKKR